MGGAGSARSGKVSVWPYGKRESTRRKLNIRKYRVRSLLYLTVSFTVLYRKVTCPSFSGNLTIKVKLTNRDSPSLIWCWAYSSWLMECIGLWSAFDAGSTWYGALTLLSTLHLTCITVNFGSVFCFESIHVRSWYSASVAWAERKLYVLLWPGSNLCLFAWYHSREALVYGCRITNFGYQSNLFWLEDISPNPCFDTGSSFDRIESSVAKPQSSSRKEKIPDSITTGIEFWFSTATNICCIGNARTFRQFFHRRLE